MWETKPNKPGACSPRWGHLYHTLNSQGSGIIVKTGQKDCKNKVVENSKETFLDPAGEWHIWIHSSVGSVHKTYTDQARQNSCMKREGQHEVPLPTRAPGSWWLLGERELVEHPSRESHMHKSMWTAKLYWVLKVVGRDKVERNGRWIWEE